MREEARQQLELHVEVAHVVGPRVLQALVVPQRRLVEARRDAGPPQPPEHAFPLGLAPHPNANRGCGSEQSAVFWPVLRFTTLAVNGAFYQLVDALVQLCVPANLRRAV